MLMSNIRAVSTGWGKAVVPLKQVVPGRGGSSWPLRVEAPWLGFPVEWDYRVEFCLFHTILLLCASQVSMMEPQAEGKLQNLSSAAKEGGVALDWQVRVLKTLCSGLSKNLPESFLHVFTSRAAML